MRDHVTVNEGELEELLSRFVLQFPDFWAASRIDFLLEGY
jgi:hypothetical protein